MKKIALTWLSISDFDPNFFLVLCKNAKVYQLQSIFRAINNNHYCIKYSLNEDNHIKLFDSCVSSEQLPLYW